jgi:hypothetical protein
VLSVKGLDSPGNAPGVTVFPDRVISDYAWSPSGELLAAVYYTAYETPNDLILYNPRTNGTVRLGRPTEGTVCISRLAFVGPSQVCVLAKEKGSSGLQAWLADGVHRTWKRLGGGLRSDREILFAAGDGLMTYLGHTGLPGRAGLRLVVRPITGAGDAGEAFELPPGTPAQLLLLSKLSSMALRSSGSAR